MVRIKRYGAIEGLAEACWLAFEHRPGDYEWEDKKNKIWAENSPTNPKTSK
jgi:hypothetical protein